LANKTTTTGTPFQLEQQLIHELQQLRTDSAKAFKITKQNTTKPTPTETTHGLKKISIGYQKVAKIINKIRILQNQTDNPYKRQDLLPFIDITSTLYPSKVNLEQTTKFGKSNLKKSFTVVPDRGALAQVILPVLKSGFLGQFDIWSIQGINVHFNLFVKGYNQTRNIDFRILQHPNTDWQATKINEEKMFLRMAALYHYNMDVTSLQRYCGWLHTGDH
jgi:hypothetical protein